MVAVFQLAFNYLSEIRNEMKIIAHNSPQFLIWSCERINSLCPYAGATLHWHGKKFASPIFQHRLIYWALSSDRTSAWPVVVVKSRTGRISKGCCAFHLRHNRDQHSLNLWKILFGENFDREFCAVIQSGMYGLGHCVLSVIDRPKKVNDHLTLLIVQCSTFLRSFCIALLWCIRFGNSNHAAVIFWERRKCTYCVFWFIGKRFTLE